MTKTRIFSGIQPTGVPHLGNYLGALRSWLELQQADAAASAPGHAAAGAAAPGPAGPAAPAHVFFSIVGLHALTVPQAGKQLRRERRAMLRCLLAIGIDPARCTLFHQEQVRVVRWKGTPGRRGGLCVGDHKSCEAAGDCALRAGTLVVWPLTAGACDRTISSRLLKDAPCRCPSTPSSRGFSIASRASASSIA